MSPLPKPIPQLVQISAAHPDARRYSRARRNLLPRHDRATSVTGLWAHEHLARAEAVVEIFLWCPGPGDDAFGSHRQDASGQDRLGECVLAVAAKARASYQISERTLARLHPGLTAPAMLSVVRLPSWREQTVLTTSAQLLLVADGIEYAGNLGTLIRTVDACGADALVLTRPVARLAHSKVFAASRGTVLTTPVLEYSSVAAAREAIESAGFEVHIADPGAMQTYREIRYDAPRMAFVVGSEGEGVAPDWRHPSLSRVSIPMLGNADSLNVAASAAILLFEARARMGHRAALTPTT